VPYNAQLVRNLSRLYICKLHSSETDFTLENENKNGETGSSKQFYSSLTLQLSPTTIIVIIPFNYRLRWSRGCVLAVSTQVCGFKPCRKRRIFRAKNS